jgi:hypothetical protein
MSNKTSLELGVKCLTEEITIEQLKEKFPVKNVAPYGNCVVVPGEDFDPDLTVTLWDKYKLTCFDAVLDFKPVTLVQLKPVDSPLEHDDKVTKLQSDHKIATAPPPEEAGLQRVLKGGKDTPLGPRWTEDEYKLLIKLWNEQKKVREIAAKFPDRSGHAVVAALARLKNSGAIKSRWTQKKGRFSKIMDRAEPPAPSGEKMTLKGSPVPPAPSTPVINTSLTIQLNVNCNDGKAVANFLKIIEKLGRNFIGIELNPNYVKIARKRLEAVPERLDAYIEK